MLDLRRLAWSIYGRSAWKKNQPDEVGDVVSQKLIALLIGQQKEPGETVLDVGCGTGRHAYRLFNAGFAVTGIDYADGMLAVAKAGYAAGELLKFLKMDISRKTPFSDHTFNHAICISSLQAMPDPAFSLNEIRRIVQPQGLVIISHVCKPEAHDWPFRKQVRQRLKLSGNRHLLSSLLFVLKTYAERHGFASYWTPDEFRSIISSSGLTILREDVFGSTMLIAAQTPPASS